MTRSGKLRAVVAAATFWVGMSIEDDARVFRSVPFQSQAEARIGRPLTPGSVAGVARRTTRRVVRRSAIYVAALPPRCTTVVVNGARLWQCGGIYYQSAGSRYVVVYVD